MGNFIHPCRSININVIPSFGRIVQVQEHQKQGTVNIYLNLDT